MTVLITGATGFIGYHVSKLLLEKSLHVRVLVRNSSNTSLLKNLGNIEFIRGDLRDYDSVCSAIQGCRRVYHLAADYRLWVPDPKTMYDINIGGTKNVMQASLQTGVEKVIYTSSVGTLATSFDGKPADENTPSCLETMAGHYKRSKFIAEQLVHDYIVRGLPAVIVNPSTPVGPADWKPTPTGKTIVDFLNGKIPAYLNTGLNFVDVADVAKGHWLASENGRIGHRYILGNKNLTLKEFFDLLAEISGKKAPGIRLPYLLVFIIACINETFSRFISHKQPRIPLTGVKMARKYMFFDCSKAIRELKIPQSSVKKALKKSTDWFVTHNYVQR